MSLDQKAKKQIMDLLVLSLDGAACKEDLDTLKEILDSSGEARDYYCMAVSIAEYVRKNDWKVENDKEQGVKSNLSHDLWQALAEQEEGADSIALERPRVRKSNKVLNKRKSIIKKLYFSAILSTAALLVFTLILNFLPDKEHIEVAVLVDAFQEKWHNSSIQSGQRLSIRSGEHYLKEGYVCLLFDNNAHVVIEGPARFEILSEDRIRLSYGSLYSRVPAEAVGFSVAAPDCLIVDLGTEFGVKVNADGDTELHVNQGKAMLITGTASGRISLETSEGFARKIYGSGNVHEIPCQSRLFVREINSETGMVWRGNDRFSLADVVGGGNGWGTGRLESGIDPITGNRMEYKSVNREGTGQYVSVKPDYYSYIDGIFVPNGPSQVVNSHGDIFKECPATNNIFYTDIIYGGGINIGDYNDRPSICMLGDKKYSTQENPSIFMHSNLGITFDLYKIREDIPDAEIVRFVADMGLSSDIPRKGNAVVWVLVDGEVKFESKVDQPGVAVPINVEIDYSARYLSLVTTDGGDPDVLELTGYRSTDSDWCVFVNPALVLADKRY